MESHIIWDLNTYEEEFDFLEDALEEYETARTRSLLGL